MKYVIIPFMLFSFLANAQIGIVGKWKSVDDETNEVKSIVQIFEKQGIFYGQILKIFPKAGEETDPICNKCPADDERLNKKIIGMEIIKDMKKSGNEYSEGNILDPEAGKIYNCKLWIEGNDLKVRGYWGLFYRTQTWHRVN